MTDLDRTISDMPKRFAVAELIGYCEGICASGVLPEPHELSLRRLVAQTLSAFGMPSKEELAAGLSTAPAAPANAALEPFPGNGAFTA